MPSKAKQAVAKARKIVAPKVEIPAAGTGASDAPKTPKTPADEGIEFFESAAGGGDVEIKVFELRLDPDGGPSKERSVCRASFVAMVR